MHSEPADRRIAWATMALVVVFLPTAMMSGIPGLFFRQFGWTAVIAVLTSLLVARILTETQFLGHRSSLERRTVHLEPRCGGTCGPSVVQSGRRADQIGSGVVETGGPALCSGLRSG